MKIVSEMCRVHVTTLHFQIPCDIYNKLQVEGFCLCWNSWL